MLSNMYRMYGSRAMHMYRTYGSRVTHGAVTEEQLPNNALITSKPVSQKHHRLDKRCPSFKTVLTDKRMAIL